MPRASSRSSLTAACASSRAWAISSLAPVGVGREALLGEAERDGHRDHPLLRAVVEVALDAAALGVGRGEDALAGAAQVVDPRAQRAGATLLGRLTRKAHLGPHRSPA